MPSPVANRSLANVTAHPSEEYKKKEAKGMTMRVLVESLKELLCPCLHADPPYRHPQRKMLAIMAQSILVVFCQIQSVEYPDDE